MLRIESALPGLAESIGSAKISHAHLLALLLSFTTHLILFLLIDSQITVAHKTEVGEMAQDRTMSIHLVASESSNNPQNTRTASRDNQASEVAKPRTVQSSQPTSQSEFPPVHFGILVPPAPHYFPSSELTVKPQVSADIPQNLGDSLTSDERNAATFRLQINEQGEVDQVIVEDSNFSEKDEHLVVNAFQKMKFGPGKIDGKVVKSELKIEVRSEKNGPLNAP